MCVSVGLWDCGPEVRSARDIVFLRLVLCFCCAAGERLGSTESLMLEAVLGLMGCRSVGLCGRSLVGFVLTEVFGGQLAQECQLFDLLREG